MEIGDYLSEKHKKRKKRRRYFYFILGAALIYVLLAGTAWVLLGSPLLRVSQVVVRGNTTVPSENVVALLQSAALRDHSFPKAILGFRNMLTWPGSLSAADLAFIPQLKAATVSKNYFFHTVTATVTERQPFAIWCYAAAGAGSTVGVINGEQCYWFDDQGVIFGRTFDTEGSLLVVIHDFSGARHGLNEAILPAQFVPNLISVVNALKASGISVKTAALSDLALEEIDVSTYNGPRLYFSLRFSADEDLPVLTALMAKSDFGKLQYVDFTVANRAYYK